MSLTGRTDCQSLFLVAVIGVLILGGVGLSLIWLAGPPATTTTPPPIPVTNDHSEQATIAAHLYHDRYDGYNKTYTIRVGFVEYTGEGRNGWLLTDRQYPRGTNFSIYVNGSLVASDWINLSATLATWQGSLWPHHIGETTKPCHVNLTLFEEG